MIFPRTGAIVRWSQSRAQGVLYMRRPPIWLGG